MSLPMPWIDKVFANLTLVYGQQFLARWRDLDLDAVKFDWSAKLDGFENHPEAIAWALQNLPAEYPPNVLQFRDIARKAPLPEDRSLPSPPANPDRIKSELAKFEPLRKIEHRSNTDWARCIIARHIACERVSNFAVKMAQSVLAKGDATQ